MRLILRKVCRLDRLLLLCAFLLIVFVFFVDPNVKYVVQRQDVFIEKVELAPTDDVEYDEQLKQYVVVDKENVEYNVTVQSVNDYLVVVRCKDKKALKVRVATLVYYNNGDLELQFKE